MTVFYYDGSLVPNPLEAHLGEVALMAEAGVGLSFGVCTSLSAYNAYGK